VWAVGTQHQPRRPRLRLRRPGDPAADAVATRDREERLGGTLAHKIRSSLTYYQDTAEAGACEIRLHSCTLYASLFRYYDDILVNPHAWGEPASANPTLHLRKLDGGQLGAHCMDSFERVWDMPSRGTERRPDGRRPH
jgi:hypothetical protein